MRFVPLLFIATTAAGAPLSLVPPQAGDFTASSSAPCGDLATPCQAPLAPKTVAPAPAPPPPAPPPTSRWTFGGSVETGIAGISGAHGAATEVGGSVWAQSPDGHWTLEAGVARQTYPSVPLVVGRP